MAQNGTIGVAVSPGAAGSTRVASARDGTAHDADGVVIDAHRLLAWVRVTLESGQIAFECLEASCALPLHVDDPDAHRTGARTFLSLGPLNANDVERHDAVMRALVTAARVRDVDGIAALLSTTRERIIAAVCSAPEPEPRPERERAREPSTPAHDERSLSLGALPPRGRAGASAERPSGGKGRPRRTPRERTPEEIAAVEERRRFQGGIRAAIEALSPALVGEDDPPLRDAGALIDISRARDVRPVLRLPRLSGRGLPGSALELSSREYDGNAGGVDLGKYLLCVTTWRDGAGHAVRGRGVAIRRGEAREVAAALVRWADELDAKDAERADDEGRT